MGGLISGLFGGGSSPGQDAQMGAIRASREDTQRYRPEAMQARLNALNNMTSAFQGANNALETLWGDPNRKVGAPRTPAQPQRMMGHDLPQQMPPSPGPQQQEDFGFNPLDPLGIFGRR